MARADDPDLRHHENVGVAAYGDQRRRVVDHLQPVRIACFADGDKDRADFSRGLDFAFGLLARVGLRRGTAAAAARQPRQRVERGARAAEMINERAEGARPDILAADKPQPVEPLLVGPPDGFRAVAHAGPKTLQNSRPCNRLNGTIPQSRAIEAWNPRYLLQNGSQTRTFRLVAAGPMGFKDGVKVLSPVPFFGGLLCTVT
jgi:hypothetical protein